MSWPSSSPPFPGLAADGDRGNRPPELPSYVYGGAWPTSHLQGVTVDRKRGFVYWSFTQKLVKTDLGGKVVGTVDGLTGHLGDIDVDDRSGRVYGSLEYKAAESFYIAVFDGRAIDRTGMNAERDGVMTAVHLDEVAADFTADMDGNGVFDGDIADTLTTATGAAGLTACRSAPSSAGGAASRRSRSRTASTPTPAGPTTTTR
ncbi:hypothetical protein NKH18_46245 [Streptomyces sp. M10(2022)]